MRESPARESQNHYLYILVFASYPPGGTSLQPILIWRLVLNLKLAARQEQHYSIGTISSLHAQVPADNSNASGPTRMSASIRELGGQMLLPGEEVDFDQDPEVRVDENAHEARGEQQV